MLPVFRKTLLVSAVAVTAGACADQPTAVPLRQVPDGAQPSAVHFWENSAPVYWNDLARQLVGTYRFNALQAIRGYAIVSLAQYNAAVLAETAEVEGADRAPSIHAAISAASVEALKYLHPAEAAALEARLDQYLAQPGWPGDKNRDEESGELVGRMVAAMVVNRAQNDGFFAPWTGTIPTGAGKWYSASAPVGAMVGQANAFFLAQNNQFRPAPPPAFGSPEFNAAIAEVRQIADTRTPAQTATAVFWNLPAGTHQPPGYWNEEATKLGVAQRLNEREMAHTLALMNMVAYDAIVASHEAKYHYWLIRPSQADPGIVLPIGLPNFPSYPSNHAAISAAMARVLGDRFPSEQVRLDAAADEAALSRVLGGIHYRFDGEAGLELGRKVAAWALERDVKGHRPFDLQ
jgi:membrane-associated phospholipid phosphatase